MSVNTRPTAASLDRVSVMFGNVAVLQDISLTIAQGEFVAVVGPSGCGKTTLLSLLSGYLKPTTGTMQVNGTSRTVYQQDGLFPWKTVRENIALGLRHMTDAVRREQALAEMLALIGLEKFGGHYPHQLSGGMKQRVELARALGGETDLLLLDEPFSSLDYLTRLRLQRELARMLAERPRTVVLVTHDIEEAAQLADRVMVFSPRPARTQSELSIDVPRPRDPTHPAVVAAVHRILTELDMEGGEKKAPHLK